MKYHILLTGRAIEKISVIIASAPHHGLYSDETYRATLPDGVTEYKALGGCLIGSVEKSSIQLLLNGEIPVKRKQPKIL